MAKAWQDEQNATNCVGADAALSPLHLPTSARREAGISTIPRHWRGRLKKLPVELQQIFLPLAEPHLSRIQKGEILKCFLFCPKVGMLILELRDDEIWATYEDWWKVACQRLDFVRFHALAKRYRTFCHSPEDGMWVWLPQQLVFPPDCRLTLPCAEYQANLLGRSPPLWWQPTVRRLETTNKNQTKTSRWLTPSVPRALRAPTCAAR